MKLDLLIAYLENQIRIARPDHFTGLGIVIVDDGATLPISSLLKDDKKLPDYKDEAKVVSFLLKISQYNDKRHDGFHIVSLKKGLLSISQYFSPPIPTNFKNVTFNIGARFRTAQYGSMVEGVKTVIVVGQSGQISIANNGIMKVLKNE